MLPDLTVFALAYGACIYRWRGTDNKNSLDRVLKRLAWALPLGIVAWVFAPWYAALAVLGASYVTVGMGHGDWMDFGHSRLSDPDEWANRFLHKIISSRDGWLHDGLGMAISGVTTMLPFAVVTGVFLSPLAGIAAGVAGAFKSVGYILGWLAYDTSSTKPYPGTEIGELLAGSFMYGISAFFIFRELLV